MNIEKHAENLKKRADEILKISGILEVLSEFGEVKPTGSYVLDAMVRPDLDFLVIAPSYSEEVLKISEKIIATKKFSEVTFVNGVDFPDQDISPSLYYVQTRINIDGTDWKLDINLTTPEKDESDQMINKWKKLLEESPEKRLTILEIKQACRQGGKYIDGVDGKLVYEAVLEENIENLEDFKKFYSLK